MLFFGGPVIRGFCIVLLLGILFGTYSSIFVASPALIEIQKRWGEGTLRGDKKKERPAPATV
jgi:preprotein translocase subunit SecF